MLLRRIVGAPRTELRPLKPSINSNIAYWLNESGDPGRALPFAERGVALGELMDPDKAHPNHLTAVENFGTSLHQTGDFDAAIARFREALEGNEARYGASNPNTGQRLIALADALRDSDAIAHRTEIRDLAGRAIRLSQPLEGEHPDLLAQARAIREALGSAR